MKAEEPKLKFWGSPAFAMLPFGLYILLGGIFSVGYHYYSMKGLIFAAVISLLAGFFVCRNKGNIGTPWFTAWPSTGIPD